MSKKLAVAPPPVKSPVLSEHRRKFNDEARKHAEEFIAELKDLGLSSASWVEAQDKDEDYFVHRIVVDIIPCSTSENSAVANLADLQAMLLIGIEARKLNAAYWAFFDAEMVERQEGVMAQEAPTFVTLLLETYRKHPSNDPDTALAAARAITFASLLKACLPRLEATVKKREKLEKSAGQVKDQEDAERRRLITRQKQLVKELSAIEQKIKSETGGAFEPPEVVTLTAPAAETPAAATPPPEGP